ncbi:lysozyme [Paraburkholderia sp.]|uniref:lysozyme n=1 Tax=Paraburkholderia sp. TaxID=1926495 RepID=UPI003D6ED716
MTQSGLWSAYLADRSIGDRAAYASLDASPWTCGWGSTGNDVTRNTTWTQAQADARLVSQLLLAGAAVDRHVTVDITSAQKAALADFVFNEGEGHFASSTLLHRLNASDFAGAASEFVRWNLANGKVLDGLSKRRAADQQLFTVGSWNP